MKVGTSEKNLALPVSYNPWWNFLPLLQSVQEPIIEKTKGVFKVPVERDTVIASSNNFRCRWFPVDEFFSDQLVKVHCKKHIQKSYLVLNSKTIYTGNK